MASSKLILASASPFRRMLMENAGLHFEAVASEIDERSIEASLDGGTIPEAVALALAQAKARDVSKRNAGAIVIGSDQTMALGEHIFHKPKDIADAANHLRLLSGATHQLNSAVVVMRDGQSLWQHVAIARLTMRDLSDAFIRYHLGRVGEKALTSVGAYQLEGEGIQLFSRIDGDYFAILGLPMLPLLEQLRRMGAIDG